MPGSWRGTSGTGEVWASSRSVYGVHREIEMCREIEMTEDPLVEMALNQNSQVGKEIMTCFLCTTDLLLPLLLQSC